MFVLRDVFQECNLGIKRDLSECMHIALAAWARFCATSCCLLVGSCCKGSQTYVLPQLLDNHVAVVAWVTCCTTVLCLLVVLQYKGSHHGFCCDCMGSCMVSEPWRELSRRLSSSQCCQRASEGPVCLGCSQEDAWRSTYLSVQNYQLFSWLRNSLPS